MQMAVDIMRRDKKGEKSKKRIRWARKLPICKEYTALHKLIVIDVRKILADVVYQM